MNIKKFRKLKEVAVMSLVLYLKKRFESKIEILIKSSFTVVSFF